MYLVGLYFVIIMSYKWVKIVMYFLEKTLFSLELDFWKRQEYDIYNSFFGLCKKGATGNECITTYSSVPCHWVYFELHTQQRAYV